MQNPSPVRRLLTPMRRIALAITPVILLCTPLPAQINNPSQQTLNLKDPTPRPPDLEKQFGTSPDDQKRQQAVVLLHNAVRHRQALAQATTMLQLSDALRKDTLAHQATGPTIPDFMKAAQIEKLAKELKDLLKS